MKFATTLAIAFSILCAFTATAQDKIYEANGNVIEAKVKSLNPRTAVYTRWNDMNGPEYSILKNDIDKIVYQDGREERFEKDSRLRWMFPNHPGFRNSLTSPMALKRHVLAIAPLFFSEDGYGLSFSYEEAIGKQGIIAYTLPVSIAFNNNRRYYYNYGNEERNNDVMFYFTPGLKFYPTSYYGKTKYAIGPSLLLGAGTHTERLDYVYNPPYNENKSQSKFVLGVLVNNSVTINATPNFNIGFDFGLGFSYINILDGARKSITGLVQGGIKLGYRY